MKNKVEALLFSSGKRMSLEEISNFTGIKDTEKLKQSLNELKQDYEGREGSLFLEEEEGFWKLSVREHYMSVAQKIVSQTELDKPLMETLAVIAWKYPVLQAEVIRIRHNKAYDHLRNLEEMGFIMRAVFGRTRKITLTQKFFEYFDLPSKEQRKEAFKEIVPEETVEKVDTMEKEIDDGEKKIEEYNIKQEEMKKVREEELKKEKEKNKKEGSWDEQLSKVDEEIPDKEESAEDTKEESKEEPEEPTEDTKEPEETTEEPTEELDGKEKVEKLKEEAQEVKEELDDLQEKEDTEIEEIKEDEEDIEEEIKKDIFDTEENKKEDKKDEDSKAKVSEVREQDEVSKQDEHSDRKE